jgi:hypothetical protein
MRAIGRHSRIVGIGFECWQSHLNGMAGVVTEEREHRLQRFVDGSRIVDEPIYGVTWDNGEHGLYTADNLKIEGK